MSDRYVRQIDRAAGRAHGSMYRKEPKIHPREVRGRFSRLRKLAVVALLGLYYGMVWLRWDDRQAVLFDLPARKFHVFGLTFWPQDFIYLTLLLILAGLALFFFTGLAGRIWCGFACPQTVWTEAFLAMERWVEGDRARRIKLDRAAWSAGKVARKSLKHALWIAFSLLTGLTFVGYFTPITELAAKLTAFAAGPWETFWVGFYSLATYGNAGFLREQVCKYMCPYARFQSAMFDHDTLVISYDGARGEPRGGRRRASDPSHKGLGDCIDCTLCVQVCPTGIDIRDGLQYECIACAACIDVCDSVMDKMDYPRGLIRYTTENALAGRRTRVVRPRIIVYAALLAVIGTGLAYGIATRVPLRMDVLHDRNALYRVLADGRIENVYALKVTNMSDQSRVFHLEVDGLPGVEVNTLADFSVAAGETLRVPLRLRASAPAGKPVTSLDLRLRAGDDAAVAVTREARFFVPMGTP